MWRLIVFVCLLPGWFQVRAVFLEDCKGVIIPQIPNANKECSEYIHCDGDNSFYCNGDCREPVQCYGQEEEETTTEEPTTTEESTTTSVATQPSIQTSPPVNTTASTASPTPPTPTPTPTPTPSSDIHVICKTSGKNGVYPYPANSNYYYQCIAGYLLLQQCPQNFHFEASQGQCISKKPYRSSSLVFHV